MKPNIGEGCEWTLAAAIGWLFVFAGDTEIYAAIGAGALGLAALACTGKAIEKFFPWLFSNF